MSNDPLANAYAEGYADCERWHQRKEQHAMSWFDRLPASSQLAIACLVVAALFTLAFVAAGWRP